MAGGNYYNLKGATISIGGVALVHDFAELEISEKANRREIKNAANTPRPKKTLINKDVEISLTIHLDADTALPAISTTAVALIIDDTNHGTGNAKGLYFSGNVDVDELSYKIDSEAENIATLTLKAVNNDDDYVLNQTGGA